MADRHRRSRLAWCLAWRGWNLRTWRKIHWSDESLFLLHVTDGQMGVWRHKNPANCPLRWRLSNGLGVYLSWLQAGFSHNTRQPNWWSVHQRRLATSCCPPPPPHFDNHQLATRPVYMDDNARHHRLRAVTAYLESEAVTSVPWPAMGPF